jgi:hypothetical protein
VGSEEIWPKNSLGEPDIQLILKIHKEQNTYTRGCILVEIAKWLQAELIPVLNGERFICNDVN